MSTEESRALCLRVGGRLWLVAALAVFGGSPATGQDIRWLSGATGTWSTPANWFGGVNPDGTTGTRDVYLNYAPYAFGTVGAPTSNSNLTTVINRVFSNSTLTITGQMTLNSEGSVFAGPTTLGTTLAGAGFSALGQFTWNSGTITGTGTAAFLGPVSMPTGSSRILQKPATFASDVSIGGGSLQLGSQQITVDAGDTWTISGGAALYDGIFTLNGALVKSGTSTAYFSYPSQNGIDSFTNNGSITVSEGILDLRGVGTHTGTVNIAGTATAQFHSAHTFADGSLVTGEGTFSSNAGTQLFESGSTLSSKLLVAAGTTTFAPGSALLLSSGLTMTGGELNLNSGALTTFDSINLAGGTLDGTDSVVAKGPSTWRAGRVQGAGSLKFESGLQFIASSLRQIDRDTTFLGDVTVEGGSVLLYNHPVVVEPSTTWTLNGSGSALYDGQMEVKGTLVRDGSGLAYLAYPSAAGADSFSNLGLVDIKLGDLEIRGGGNHTGDFSVASGSVLRLYDSHNFVSGSSTAGGTVQFFSGSSTFGVGSSFHSTPNLAGGSATFSAGSVFANTGPLQSSGGSLTLNTGANIGLGSLSMTGGTLDGSDNISFTGTHSMSSGTISGSGTLTVNGQWNLPGTSSRTISRPTTVNGPVDLQNGAIFLRSGTFTIAPTSTFTVGGTSPAVYDGKTIVNGTLVFNQSGTGYWAYPSHADADSFENRGNVSCLTGITDVRGDGRQTGDFSISSGAKMLLQGSFNYASGSATTGTGAMEFAGGTSVFEPGSSLSSKVDFSGGTTTFQSGAILSLSAPLTVSGGTAQISTGNAIAIPGLNLTSGTLGGNDNFVVSAPTTWASGTISGDGTVTFNSPVTFLSTANRTLARNATLNADVTYVGSLFLGLSEVTLASEKTWTLSGAGPELYDGKLTNHGRIVFNHTSGIGYLGYPSKAGADEFNNQGELEISRLTELRSPVANYDHPNRRLTGGVWRMRNAVLEHAAGPMDVQTNAADVALHGASALFRDSGSLNALRNLDTNLGSFRLFEGAAFTRVGSFSNAGLIEVGPSSSFTSTSLGMSDGNLIVNGNLNVSPVVGAGRVRGNGTINGALTMNGGTLSGGNTDVGTLTISGNTLLTANSTVLAELKGPGAGNYDVLAVGGVAGLAGSLEVEMSPGYSAVQGDTFRVLTATGGVGNSFDSLPDPEDWSVNVGANFVDVTALRTVFSPVTVSGTVGLQQWDASLAGVTVEFELRQNGQVVQTESIPLLQDGSFRFATTRRGPVDISFKASHWLRRTVANLNIPENGLTGVNPSLINGDVDGDNSVTVFDYGILSDAFDTVEGDAGFAAEADLDGDGAITVFDYGILSDNFDLTGDE